MKQYFLMLGNLNKHNQLNINLTRHQAEHTSVYWKSLWYIILSLCYTVLLQLLMNKFRISTLSPNAIVWLSIGLIVVVNFQLNNSLSNNCHFTFLLAKHQIYSIPSIIF